MHPVISIFCCIAVLAAVVWLEIKFDRRRRQPLCYLNGEEKAPSDGRAGGGGAE